MEMKTRVRLRRPKPLRLTLTGCEGNHQHIVMLLWAGTFHWIDALQAICSDVYESLSIYIYIYIILSNSTTSNSTASYPLAAA